MGNKASAILPYFCLKLAPMATPWTPQKI